MIDSWPLSWLQDEIRKVLVDWVAKKRSRNYWRDPLVAVASATDPAFHELRLAVSPEHAMPEDILPGARSVIVFFLPFQPWLGRENDAAGFHAARAWAESYIVTNELIQGINAHLREQLNAAGHRAAITPATHNFDEKQLISWWSHKHLGYIAGLGTFGRHHLLITAAGCCGRLGSLVTSMPLPPSPRPDGEWCLEKAGVECFACVSKCVYDALHENTYDRHRCYEQCLTNDRYYNDLPLVDVCGKCACEVPCSYGIPGSIAAAAERQPAGR